MTRGIAAALVMASLAACGGSGGWSDNQKEAVKLTLAQSFVKGLSSTNKTATPSAVDTWATCVQGKIIAKWPSFDDFQNHQSDPSLEKFQQDCADQTKLMDAIK